MISLRLVPVRLFATLSKDGMDVRAGEHHASSLTTPRCRKALSFGLLVAAVLALALNLGAGEAMKWATRDYLYEDVARTPARPVALVFGAGYRPNGQPSMVMLDRVMTAVDLYKRGKVRKILVSGDNGSPYYNEVAVMRRVAMSNGVPGRDVVKDHAGFRTYDSCYRAREVFMVRGAILVTQAYHLPRAVYLARRMGIDAVGVAADRHQYSAAARFALREQVACAWSWVEVNVTHPLPRFLGPRLPVMEQVAAR